MNFVQDTYDRIRTLKDEAKYMWHISDMLYRVGNEKLANDIAESAENIFNSADELDKLISADILKQYRQSEESTGNVIRAALVGIKITKGE